MSSLLPFLKATFRNEHSWYEEAQGWSLLEHRSEGADCKFRLMKCLLKFVYEKVLISFLTDCSGFCTCCLLCCSLRPIKLLPAAHLECLQSSRFSTELQLDLVQCSEGLSSLGLLFQSLSLSAICLGVVTAVWSC